MTLLTHSWHGKPCRIVTMPVFRPGIKRNVRIEFSDGTITIVPWRAIRRIRHDPVNRGRRIQRLCNQNLGEKRA